MKSPQPNLHSVTAEPPVVALRSRQGLDVYLGRKLASGGEGTIYEVRGNPQVCAKIYHQAGLSLQQRAEKITAMVSLSTLARTGHLAWPFDTVHTFAAGRPQFCGFLMRRFHGPSLLTLTTPASLLARIPAASEPGQLPLYLLAVLTNLAGGFHTLESVGVLPSDISEANFLLDPATASVAFIDCDGYQVPASSGQIHPARATTGAFLPPELLANTSETLRTPAHLRFSVAVLFFQILTHGWHPYSTKGAASPEENILNGKTAMGSTYGLATGDYPPRIRGIYNALHRALKVCLINSLVRGHRDPAIRTDFIAWQHAISSATNVLEHARRVRCRRS